MTPMERPWLNFRLAAEIKDLCLLLDVGVGRNFDGEFFEERGLAGKLVIYP
jgi:hypothetical protein